MSILNLNTPQGGNSVGKKKTKIWMGAGLLAAVLGVGSTLAANITINSPEGNTEFGQGVTQTVYCGEGETSVKVTPASSYTNATTWISPNPSFNIINNFSGTGTTSVSPVTIYGNTGSLSPQFLSSSSSKVGWWLPNPTATASPSPIATQPTAAQVAAAPSSYYFTERSSDGTFRRPAPTPSVSAVAVKVSDELANFKLGKVVISNIPAACNGVNFVLSSYGLTSDLDPNELSLGARTEITEVAVLWNAGNPSTPTYPSQSRTSFEATKPSSGSTCLVTTSQTSNSLTFSFRLPKLAAKDSNKLVIETQEDAITAGSSSCSS